MCPDPAVVPANRRLRSAVIWLLGLAAVVAGFVSVDGFVANVVNYRAAHLSTLPVPVPRWWPALVLPLLVLAGLAWFAVRDVRLAPARLLRRHPGWGLLVLAGLACVAFELAGRTPVPESSALYVLLLIGLLQLGLAGDLAAGGARLSAGGPLLSQQGASDERRGADEDRTAHRAVAHRDPFAPGGGRSAAMWLALLLVAAAVAVATTYHTLEQAHFWRHFMLGYADFGFFTVDLEQCLPGKDLGSARFADTGMAYHVMPLFYALAPLYAVFRSPVFLMAVGSLCLQLPALIFARFTQRRTGSPTAGVIAGLAWLLLPSVSRLPYAGTYGFQAVYLAIPLLALTVTLGLDGRWRWSSLCLVLAVLCKETVCGFALGWGVYVALGARKPRLGWTIAGLAVGYAALALGVVAPALANAGQTSRVELFGAVSLGEMAHRLSRLRVWLFLGTLAIPLGRPLLRQWRLALAGVPTLVLVVLLADPDYISLKFWHHSSVLPVLFAAALLGCLPRGNSQGKPAAASPPLRLVALLLAIAAAHQLFGFSPLTQAYRVQRGIPHLRQPDPRLAGVQQVRELFPPDDYTIVATERVAAHFTDYHRVQTLSRAALAPPPTGWDLYLIDPADRWDTVVRSAGADAIHASLLREGYRLVGRYAGLHLYARPGLEREP